jgi:thiol-disulfide isomerase/thioredoxin
MANLHDVKSSDHFKALLSEDLQRVSLLYFWAPWAEPCKQMTEVVAELSRKYPKLLSLQIEAEERSEIAESFGIESVPTFIVLRVRHSFASSSRSMHSDPRFFQRPGSHVTQSHCRRRCSRTHYDHSETCGFARPHHATFSVREIPCTSTSCGGNGDS